MRVLRWGMYMVGQLVGRDRIGIYRARLQLHWDSGIGDLRSSMEALRHPSRAPPAKATQYMSQYLMRARGSETGSMFHEGALLPPGVTSSPAPPSLMLEERSEGE
jgi:hypothetical protein